MAREIDDESGATGDRLFEQRTVAFTELLEAALEPLLEAGEDVPRWFRGRPDCRCSCGCDMVSLQHIFRHGRHQRARQDEGGEHRDDDRLRHRLEQPAGDAAEIEEREPDDRDAERGDERRDDDLIGGVDDRLSPAACPFRDGVSIFSIITVASSTRMPTASANPPKVMTLIDSPSQCRPMMRGQDGERDRGRRR